MGGNACGAGTNCGCPIAAAHYRAGPPPRGPLCVHGIHVPLAAHPFSKFRIRDAAASCAAWGHIVHRDVEPELQVPFDANSMSELKVKVMSGRQPTFDTQCCGAVKNLCLSMMSYDTPRGPSLTRLLNTIGAVPLSLVPRWHSGRCAVSVVCWSDACTAAWLRYCHVWLEKRCWPVLVGWRLLCVPLVVSCPSLCIPNHRYSL